MTRESPDEQWCSFCGSIGSDENRLLTTGPSPFGDAIRAAVEDDTTPVRDELGGELGMPEAMLVRALKAAVENVSLSKLPRPYICEQCLDFLSTALAHHRAGGGTSVTLE